MTTKVVKWLVYGAGTVLASEVILHFYEKWKKEQEINIAIVTRDQRDLRLEDKYLTLLYKDLEPTNIHRHVYMLERLIDSATVSINICMYIFTSSKLSEALVRAKQRGVKVRVVIEKTMENSTNSQRLVLTHADIPVRIENKNTLHHKFMLIDVPHKRNLVSSTSIVDNDEKPFFVPKNGLVMTGSMNFTLEALTNNHENIIITSNKKMITPILENFFVIWDNLDPMKVDPNPKPRKF